jgi:hypothetical protein
MGAKGDMVRYAMGVSCHIHNISVKFGLRRL